MSTDVLFIHPGNQSKDYQGLSREFTAIATPSWTLLLAQFVRNTGITVALYDVNVEGWSSETASALLSSYNPNLVLMMVYGHHPSASTQTMPAARRIANDLKRINKDLPIAFGGTHPSALPERTLLEEPIDFVIQGEGVHCIAKLAKSVRSDFDLNAIPGLWFRKNGVSTLSSPPALIENLDRELDGYAWDLLPRLDTYRAHNMHCFQDFRNSEREDFLDIRSPYVALNTSLGCPFSCNYCCINAIFGKPGIRYWSTDTVASWLHQLSVNFGVRNVRFDDELFLLSASRVEDLCDKLIEMDLNLNIWVYGRVDTIQSQLLHKMKLAGINWICLGIESGNQDVLRNANKRIPINVRSVVSDIQDHGIYVLGNYMFGLPGDNHKTMRQTLDLAIELNTEFANFYSVMAYPGSKLFEKASERSGLLPEGWDGYSQFSYSTYPLATEHLSPGEILFFRDKAFQEYHSNPDYLMSIKNKFGERVVEHILRMMDIKVHRKILES